MNEKQSVVIIGLIAYVIGGLIVILSDTSTFSSIIHLRPHLLIPIFKTYGILFLVGIGLIYFLRSKDK